MSDPSQDDFSLAGEFPPASRDAWLELVAAALKGAPFEKLVSKTYDGLPVGPLYAPAIHAKPVMGRPPGTPWEVLTRVDHPEPAAAKAEARHELENGAAGLAVAFAGSIGAYGYGLACTEEAIGRVLDGMGASSGVLIECSLAPPALDVAALAGVLARLGLRPEDCHIRFGLDPLGTAAATGRFAAPWEEFAAALAAQARALAQAGFRGPFAVADARPIHAAGGSHAQELACALASAVTYLRALDGGGIAIEEARRMIFFRLVADADQLLTIAKFRALRRLWARVEESCGLEPQATFLSAETAWRMMSRHDPWVNMLRATVATFAAGIGGADAVTVLPFTLALGLPDRFARRMARNTQLILLEEANLARVADPSAGSGALEQLTADLCRAAWSLFQRIEATGGAPAALAGGLIQRLVAGVRAERRAAIALRRERLTGISEFPQLAQVPVSVLAVARIPPPPARSATAAFEPLAAERDAEPYERLREKSDEMLAANGRRPRVFLAALGPPATFSARAAFARSFFEAGGIEAVLNEAPADRDAMVSAFRASGAQLACLCSTDEIYASEGVAAAVALSRGGAAHLYVAGRPGAHEAVLRKAGVETFIHAGSDVLAILAATYEHLAA